MLKKYATPLFFIGFISFAAFADGSMRCGSSLIVEGDPSAKLLLKCGRPLTVDERTRMATDDWGHRQIIKTGEVWTMDMGSDNFLQIVTVEGGIIKDIKDGPRP